MGKSKKTEESLNSTYENTDDTSPIKKKNKKKQFSSELIDGGEMLHPVDAEELPGPDNNLSAQKKESKKRKFKAVSEEPIKKRKCDELDETVAENLAKATEEKLKERDRRTLFVRGKILRSIEVSELMRIADGVDDIRRKGHIAYFVFKSEKKATKGYKKLQGFNLHGEELYVDYVGEKSSVTVKDKYNSPQEVDPFKLFVSGVPVDAFEEDVREVFTKAQEIVLPKNFKNNFKYALVSFANTRDAQEAFDEKDISIKGKPVTVFFAKKLKSAKPSGVRKEKKSWR
jgi:hypothetical protein